MVQYTTKRTVGSKARIVGRSPEDYAQELQELLDAIHDQVNGGIPAGFNETVPTTIQAGVAGSAGAETDGWMAAGAVIPIETAAPSNPTGSAAAEGTGTALMRADAIVKQGIVTTKGDLLGHSATIPVAVAVGTNGQVLVADSSAAAGVAWSDAALNSRRWAWMFGS